MVFFKVLLIILIALPVIALASYFYSQMLSFIKVRNDIENKAVKLSVAESEPENKGKRGKKRKRKEKKEKKEKQK